MQPEGTIISLPTGAVSDAIFSPAGNIVYTVRGGSVTGYDTGTGALVATYKVGKDLGGVDISADGKYLIAAENVAGPTNGMGGWDAKGDVYVHRLDLVTGDIKTYTYQVTGYDGPFHDASFLSDGTVVLTKTFYGSGHTPLTMLDPATGTFAVTVNQTFAQDGTLTATADKSHVLVMPSNISDAPVYIYEPGKGITASHGLYADGVSGFNSGIQAISPSGNFVAQGVGQTIYDGSLKFVVRLSTKYSFLAGTGFAFSPDDTRLYVLDANSHQIMAFDTKDWTVAASYRLDAEVTGAGYYGDGLQLSKDGTRLSVIGGVSVEVIDLRKAVSDGGTRDADTLQGNSDNNVIYGLEGNDTIAGGGGQDTIYGGKGDDTYLVDDLDTLVEFADEGFDTVIAKVDGFTLNGEIEALVLADGIVSGSGSHIANTLTGNGLDNRLLGNDGDDRLIGAAGNDLLDGGLGNDTLEGGLGDDRYYIDSPADKVVELAGEGSDTVFAQVSYTLGANVEKLELLGDRQSLNGTGNALANVLTGNAGDNRLNGLGGNDVLDGGEGNDIAIFSGARADYGFARLGAGLAVIDHRGAANDGGDLVLRTETLQFKDGSVAVSTLLDGLAAPTADWRLFTGDGFSGAIGGSGTILGTAGFQAVSLRGMAGEVTLDPSFNRGGDVVTLAGDAAQWAIARTGSSAWLYDGTTTVTIPIGAGMTAVTFDDGARGLRFDQASQSFKIGAQSFDAVPAIITASADLTSFPANPDPAAQARLLLAEGGEASAAGNVAIVGTPGHETVMLEAGTFAFDPSFNRGGDTIVFAGQASGFSARVVGSSVLVAGDDTSATIPVGTTASTLTFAGEDMLLRYDAVAAKVYIDDQLITSTGAVIA